MSNLHWCYTFCTGVTLFALVLHLNCTALSQSESSNFFMCIIKPNMQYSNHECTTYTTYHFNTIFTEQNLQKLTRANKR